jgi:hypothetical protein
MRIQLVALRLLRLQSRDRFSHRMMGRGFTWVDRWQRIVLRHLTPRLLVAAGLGGRRRYGDPEA